MERVTLGMGCFWGPEARFGYHTGVIKTRVGYAGGTEGQPTSRNTLDYTEALEILYDADVLSLDQILNQFFQQHNTMRPPRSIKYRSVLFYHNEEQQTNMLQKVEEMKRLHDDCYTYVEFLDSFYEAEIRHQKYFLQRWKPIFKKWQELQEGKESLTDSTLAVRLNGLYKSCGSLEELKQEFPDSAFDSLWSLIREDSMNQINHSAEERNIEQT
ncbi:MULTISPECIES: peptide-methionine (S)-S-oxide reductase [Bacillales]|uniref:peptide-methionine (S)-S-oxide reductase n=1 Tax=Bacillales TaxID=1385 RepID=UPI001E5A8FE9|nr:peptide-methionine (S)-S-oxide reductase [Metabacillus sp. B2-18]UGB30969.1 peptide-methionine (S)-S-oxide reductase [Metabacillus sp. B2-18]